MSTKLSPGVYVREIDLTATVPTAGSSGGAFAGNFAWGPVDQITTISNSNELLKIFGKPTDANYVDWFSCSSFLSYTGNLKIVRVIDEDAKNADNTGTGVVAKNASHFEAVKSSFTGVTFASKYPGALGNSLSVELADADTFAAWDASYKNIFDSAPGTSDSAAGVGASNDELHILVIDKLGLFTGNPGEVLERFSFLSKASDAVDANGAPNYYVSVLNRTSQYVWGVNPISGAALAGNVGSVAWGIPLVNLGVPSVYDSLGADLSVELSGGANSTAVAAAELIAGLNMFENAEEVDVSLIFLGDAGGSASHTAVVQHAIDNICEARQDCMVFFSPKLADVLNVTQSAAVTNIVTTRNAIARSSSYAVMDSGWKLVYDVYSDVHRWIPLNADIAGLCARVDNTNDPWWSPGGNTRGLLKNVVSLAFNPNKTSRDEIYKVNVNPVVTFNGQGTMLYGDKTLLPKNSAFSQIGVRRLFIVLRKSISRAAQDSLFEFNDVFTRASFLNRITPFLREVQGRRGMQDFAVVCDETNNTPEVIMNGEFVASIFIKPNYSIQTIQLNFVAVRRDVEFTEVVGVGV